jgi:VWA domain containing CoxE-like protein
MFSFCNKAALLAVSLVFLCSAQAQNAENCPQRTVIVNVRDQQGQQVAGLQPTSFRASLRGQSVKIVSDKVPTTSPRIALLVDISGSVNHHLKATKVVAEKFVAGSTTSRIALVLFSDHIIDTFGFDSTPSAMLQRLAGLADGHGTTALMDSLAYSADLFHTREAGDAIYVISDGEDNHSKLHEKEVERKLLSRGIRTFSVLWQTPLATLEEEESIADFQILTKLTGGSSVDTSQYQSAKGREQLDASVMNLYDMMRNFYELEIEIPPQLKMDQRWELQIVDTNGKKRKDIELAYPRNLVACGGS